MNKKYRQTFTLLLSLAAVVFISSQRSAEARGLPLGRLNLPPGFKISVYAREVPGARAMTMGSNGTLYVGSRDQSVYAIPDADRDYKGDSVITLLKGLNAPNGVEYRHGSLYVAEVHRIVRYDNIDSNLTQAPTPQVVNKAIPDKQHHGQKYLKFGPDGWLYVAVGAPCNVCEPPDWRFASILKMKEDGTEMKVFASGIRNSVGFDWHPTTKQLWFTDNGRDWLGDDSPPEELNCAPKQGLHFGFPYCHGGNIADPEFGKKRSCSEFTSPEIRIPAHHAALGVKFYSGQMFPSQYHLRARLLEQQPARRLPIITGAHQKRQSSFIREIH